MLVEFARLTLAVARGINAFERRYMTRVVTTSKSVVKTSREFSSKAMIVIVAIVA